MSQSESSPPALGSREDFWGDPDPSADRGHMTKDGVSFEEWVAGRLLRKHPDARILCPTCLYNDDAAVELTKPKHYVEESEIEKTEEADDGLVLEEWTEFRYSDHRRHRVCPRCDQVCWGGTLDDLPKEKFREVIVEFFGRFSEQIPDFRQEKLLKNAMVRKSGGMDDDDNLERLLTELEFGGTNEH